MYLCQKDRHENGEKIPIKEQFFKQRWGIEGNSGMNAVCVVKTLDIIEKSSLGMFKIEIAGLVNLIFF